MSKTVDNSRKPLSRRQPHTKPEDFYFIRVNQAISVLKSSIIAHK